jgi:2-succinyl-6-hydroxy-2,4-cyclohexadiene-1-carboxylate synthase
VSGKALKAPQTLVLLHGFGGTSRSWEAVIGRLDTQRYRPLALDLPGHGSAASRGEEITFERCVESVLEAAPERFMLCGYSLGGRIALLTALAAPARVRRLILIASSPGIEDRDERTRRRAADRRLADLLERVPFEQFAEAWQAQPLFVGDPPEVAALACVDQRRNDPLTLAAAMRGIGTGEMQPLWSRLAELTMPVTVIVGRRDAKFRDLGQRMAALLPRGELLVVPGGHRLALENPGAVADAIGLEPSVRA